MRCVARCQSGIQSGRLFHTVSNRVIRSVNPTSRRGYSYAVALPCYCDRRREDDSDKELLVVVVVLVRTFCLGEYASKVAAQAPAKHSLIPSMTWNVSTKATTMMMCVFHSEMIPSSLDRHEQREPSGACVKIMGRSSHRSSKVASWSTGRVWLSYLAEQKMTTTTTPTKLATCSSLVYYHRDPSTTPSTPGTSAFTPQVSRAIASSTWSSSVRSTASASPCFEALSYHIPSLGQCCTEKFSFCPPAGTRMQAATRAMYRSVTWSRVPTVAPAW